MRGVVWRRREGLGEGGGRERKGERKVGRRVEGRDVVKSEQ